MAKLTKSEARDHKLALELLAQPALTHDDVETVFHCFHEGANSINSDSGAFFTPLELAYDFALECGSNTGKGTRIIDLCAGIGVLSHAILTRYPDAKVICVERNPSYVEVGRKLVPNATWICADIADPDTIAPLGTFDIAVSNPPFGRVRSFKGCTTPRYTGSEAEYKVIDIAALIASYGVFLLPQQSSGFQYSGQFAYLRKGSSKFDRFTRETGIDLMPGIGIDTTHAAYGHWKSVSPLVEVACADFEDDLIIPVRDQADIFENAA